MTHLIQTHHPRSLITFFLTEMWERYGFYVLQTLLALYLALHYRWPDENVYALVGSFTALTYLSPIIGGWIADNWLGQKFAVLLGAVLLFLNYVMLTLLHNEKILLLALAGIAIGAGLLKPNISSLLGNQYAIGSNKKEQGFTIFYMGINSGIICATIIPNQINHYFGWTLSFASAALGMAIAFATFYIGVKKYKILDYHEVTYSFGVFIKTAIVTGALWIIFYAVLNHADFANILFILVTILASSYIVYIARRETKQQAKQTIILGLLCIISVMFWSFYFQMFTSLTLFLLRVVQPTFCGIHFPPPYYLAIQSIGVLVFGYFFSKTKTIVSHNTLSISRKFLLAMLCLLISYGLIVLITHIDHSNRLLSPLYFIPVYLFISLGELLLSPVGLSAVTTLACKYKVSTMMGIFFVSLGIGGFLSGKLAAITAIDVTNMTVAQLKIYYATGFQQLLLILLVITAISVILHFIIKKLLESDV